MSQIPADFSTQIRMIRQKLLDHFGMPEWRNPLPPVDELVSTILSQNTNDVNRDAAFVQLTSRFPDWKGVMDAPESDVIDAIRTAGLANQKGPRIQNALIDISTHAGGKLDLNFLSSMSREESRKWLLNVKGVGPKAYGKESPMKMAQNFSGSSVPEPATWAGLLIISLASLALLKSRGRA